MNRRLWIVMLAIFGGFFISETAFAQTANPRPLPSRDIRGPVPEVFNQGGAVGRPESPRTDGRLVTTPSELPSMGALRGMTLCVSISRDNDALGWQGEVCGPVKQVSRWGFKEVTTGRLEIEVDWFYRPPSPAGRVVGIAYYDNKAVSSKPGWVAVVQAENSKGVTYSRGVPIDSLRLFQ